jgi:hypothetical protein
MSFASFNYERYAHMNLFQRVGLAFVFLCPITAAGCSGGDFDSSVSGTVTLDGQAIGPGFLVFAPVTGDTNPANGAIQTDGSYELKTANTTGLRAGKYRVSVTVLDQPDVPPGERSYVVAKSRIPEKYNDANTSGMEFDVESGSNTIDIPLKSN